MKTLEKKLSIYVLIQETILIYYKMFDRLQNFNKINQIGHRFYHEIINGHWSNYIYIYHLYVLYIIFLIYQIFY